MKYWIGIGILCAAIACISFSYFMPIYLMPTIELPQDEELVLNAFSLSEADRYGGVGIRLEGRGKTEW